MSLHQDLANAASDMLSHAEHPQYPLHPDTIRWWAQIALKASAALTPLVPERPLLLRFADYAMGRI